MISEDPDVRRQPLVLAWYIPAAVLITSLFLFLSLSSGGSQGESDIPTEDLGGVICTSLILFNGFLFSVILMCMNILGYSKSSRTEELTMHNFTNRIGFYGVALGVLTFLLCIGTMQLSTYTLAYFNIHIEEKDPIIEALAHMSASSKLMLTFLVLTVVPIVEELIFRYTLYRALRHIFPHIIASLASALMFAAAHDSFTAFPLYFVFAIFLQEVYHRTHNLYYPIMMHCTFNLLMITLASF